METLANHGADMLGRGLRPQQTSDSSSCGFPLRQTDTEVRAEPRRSQSEALCPTHSPALTIARALLPLPEGPELRSSAWVSLLQLLLSPDLRPLTHGCGVEAVWCGGGGAWAQLEAVWHPDRQPGVYDLIW